MKEAQNLLRATGLFDRFSQAELNRLTRSANLIRLPSNWKIITEGEFGVDFFVIVEGSLQVFTENQEGNEIVLAKLGKGAFVGEQALLQGLPRRRNASVRTAEPSMLLRIDKEYLWLAVDRDAQLGDRLLKIGEKQVIDNLVRQSSLFQAFNLGDASEWQREVSFAGQEVIFNEGDPGDYFYLILEGSVSIFQQFAGQQKQVSRLAAGQGFGELALLVNAVRRATVIAEEDVRLLQVDGRAFRAQFQKEPKLREYFHTLQKVYPLIGQGVVTQHSGKFLEYECITMVFHFNDGRKVISSKVIGHEIISIQVTRGSDPGQVQKLRYVKPELEVEREVVLEKNVPIGVISHGAWVDIGKVHRMILDQTSLTDEEVQRFRQNGNFFQDHRKDAINENGICCECMQVNYGAILEVVRNGYHSIEEVAEVTGCTTVCGACRPQVREILGEGGWTPVMVDEEYEIVPGTRSFLFSPYGPRFKPAKPGQHVVIKIAIDGNWVMRPYTITSPANETATREVTIKREANGYFSNWIFDHRKPDAILQISDPQGDYYVDLSVPEPIICLAAGIGITPALAVARTILAEQKPQTVHIDYSARTDIEFVHREQLEDAARQYEQIRVNFRNTQVDGRITREDVKQLVQKYPDARIYICGPAAYQEAVTQYLHELEVQQNRVHIEEFTPVGGAPSKQSFREWLAVRSYLPIGLFLLGAFVLQEVFQLKWPWLEGVQATEALKRWTGLFLTLFILFQWYLPLLRWRKKLKAAAGQYQWHKLIGAFSPLAYYVHSTKLGFAFLYVLSLVYFANFVLGLFNQEIIPDSQIKKTYGYYWLLGHIILSVSMISLILYHVYIAFAYH